MGAMPKPGDVFGRYEITTRIGRGGMGVVFSARQVDLNREVALKLLSPDLADSPEYRNRFAREASALGRIDSPHVIHVYEAGEHDGWLFIATQLVDGGDLQQWMSDNGPLTPYAAVDLVAQVAIGLRDAHQLGILHRDIKPSNVLLKNTDDGLRAYLCDLGISQLLDAEHTRTTGAIGTLGYMAPERHEGSDASVASDIYALGCLLWAALTGTAPYTGTDMHVALAHVREPVRQLGTDVPGARELNVILARSMAKAPDDRYPDAGSMIGALRSALVAIGAGVAEPTVVSTTPGPPVSELVAPPINEITEPTEVRPARTPPPATSPDTRPGGRGRLLAGIAALLLVAAGFGAWFLASGGDDQGAKKTSGTSRTTPSATPSATPTGSSSASPSTGQPNQVTNEHAGEPVAIYSAGVGPGPGRAYKILTRAGWNADSGGGPWADKNDTSRVYYPKGFRASALQVAKDLGISDIRERNDFVAGQVYVVIARDYPAR